jgi:hypothetical protein
MKVERLIPWIAAAALGLYLLVTKKPAAAIVTPQPAIQPASYQEPQKKVGSSTAQKAANVTKNVSQYALAGAAAGTAGAPGVGTAIGAGIGAAVGLIYSAFS